MIPVTLVTGFLGAGKTTLLNHLLATSTGRRFAVIENEFGDIGMDGSLLSASRDVVFELNDGCVCCTVREDLIAVFERLVARAGEIDHVIIETTGLADPSPVMRLFEQPAVRSTFVLDGVVTVVDAGHVVQSLSEAACAEQIATADLLILNKTDLVPAPMLVATEERLRRLNPLAIIRRAARSRIDAEAVLALGGRALTPEHHHHDHGHSHGHDHGPHSHDDTIASVAVSTPGSVDVVRLDRWLDQLLRRPDMDLLRMKGILAVPGDPRRFVFHAVRRVLDVRPERAWGDAPRVSRIVFIGRGLDAAALQAGFLACQHPT